mgnify:CR=1 FL=1
MVSDLMVLLGWGGDEASLLSTLALWLLSRSGSHCCNCLLLLVIMSQCLVVLE